MGKGMGRGSRLGCLGECHKLPSGARKRVLEYSEVEKIAPDSHRSVIFDISASFTFTTITKHKTFTYIFVPFAQLRQLCKFFFHSLWGA